LTSYGPLGGPIWNFTLLVLNPLTGNESIYKANGLVGKSAAQVGRRPDGTFSSSDSDIYTKWAQAISSAQDLVSRAYFDRKEHELNIYFV
jgi:hypothetical protein